MEALPSGLLDPAPQRTIQLVHRRWWCATGQEVALDVTHATLFDLALESGGARWIGIDEESVVFGTFPVGALRHRVVEAGLDNRRLEVVGHHPRRYPTPRLKGVAVAQEPRLYLLVEHQFRIEVPAPRQHHDKHPRLARGTAACATARRRRDMVRVRGVPWEGVPWEGVPREGVPWG